jgi:hypothetical protein
MSEERKHYSPEEKVAILHQHVGKKMIIEAFLYWVILSAFAACIFIANRNHHSEQGQYYYWHFVLAHNLVHGVGYRAEPFSEKDRDKFPFRVLRDYPPTSGAYGFGTKNAEPAVGPMWGYPLLLALGLLTGYPVFFMSALQYVLSLVGIGFFYRIFEIPKRLWHIPLFLPFFAEMSVKWNQTIPSFLGLVYVYCFYSYLKLPRRRLLYLPGLILGVAANFRPEYSILPFVQLLGVCLPHCHERRRSYLNLTLTTCGLTFLCLLPWALHSYKSTSQVRFTSQNGGIVLLYGLSDLPNNPWGITGGGFDYLRIITGATCRPCSAEEDSYYRQYAIRCIRQYPMSFAKKVVRSAIRSVTGGVYMGEFYTLTVNTDRFAEIEPLWRDRSKILLCFS